MAFAVAQDTFSGPLGLLLELLNKKELEIKDVALASIADDFLSYLDNHDVPSDELADFLLIATRLIYLKSKELMPYILIDEEEEQIASLEDQLRLYREFVSAADKLEERFEAASHIFMRPYKKIEQKKSEGFLLAKNVTQENLSQTFLSLLKKLEPFFALQEVSLERVKSVEERMNELKGAIMSRASIKFKEVLKGAKNRPDVVVSFLALLELIRRQVVRASQNIGDSDIIIEKI